MNNDQAPPRDYSAVDRLIGAFDQLIRTAAPAMQPATRPSPAEGQPELPLMPSERRHSAGLMRVNHTGEVCAQALYLGQSLVARDDQLKRFLTDASAEERDHLIWCAERLAELKSRPSILNPAWYVGSIAIALAAAAISDAVSLGFVEETERQVCAHLEGHLTELSADDRRSRAIVDAMGADEAQHAINARRYGASELPEPVKRLMGAQARVMTTLAYWL
jgi:ubiquinone biosynthesis monooxygenase Coq7